MRKQKNFAALKKQVWAWYRKRVSAQDLNAGDKIVLWAITERFRMETFSSHDSITYYAKMVGMNRRSVGRSIKQLIVKNIIWCVLESEPNKVLKQSQSAGRKHYLLVGLGALVDEAVD
mgnify:CR=1 FL=1